ncbi:hypothetical protein [Streptomyces rapamycinicus]|uniref:Transcriptional regulator n=2 Tax=Streptomyces rapamycinicus TaxID=1226757 RepID=A0A0A0NTS1_STRRN|nr:hypothetical protein [Streptomyces rapamycinicus]AGP58160.1 hypothetical protein M271_33730 [Streptomyces rapamycinicus NRRL 5491]MBB4785839.1 transcriptional regulator with XRE-family HTH domain [Streptomyces rapamycinicus]RLV78697.1 hypothetical protein D3C57_109970 [Streptomyces rapamycinicus NRRL 5491]UTO65989.1 hypothetical protein LJB45_29135 [Streptomyces rapamycinicus]UTP33943.1 hypothetical protein LIV37_34265 [Streptomyces rapamycinicus NRRL 5491]
MSTGDSLRGAAALKALRKARGWSLADAARALIDTAHRLGQPLDSSVPSVQRSVARWESARCPVLPGDRYRLLLAHLYARGADGHVALGPGSDFAELLDALAHLGEADSRLSELRALLVRTATDDGTGLLALLAPTTRRSMAAALTDPARVDEALLAGLMAAVDDVNSQVGSLPFARLQLLLAPVTESCRRLLSGGVPEPLLPELRTVATQAYTLAGRLAFETRDDQASRALYAAGTATAGPLGDRWRRAVVHMSHALVTLYSTPGLESARQLVDAAVRDARTGDSVRVRARAHALQAEIAARSGSERHAQTALSLARYDLDRESNTGTDPSDTNFSADHLRGFEGLCELYVGDAAVAHDFFAGSVAALGSARERVQRTVVSTDQALACIRLDAPESAATLLHSCVDSAASTGGRVPALRLRRARKELRPWRREGFVADLDDHLIDMLGS